MADPQIQNRLPENAYRELKPGETYVPMVPPGAHAPEVTTRSIIFGIVMNIIWAAAATFLALKVGQGIETAIPISILAVGLSGALINAGARRSSIIENVNILAIGTTSGIVAGGTVFTMPAIYLLNLHENLQMSTTSLFLQIFLVPFFGAVLGVVFLVPFRRYFVKEMHGKLPFPEATATNEILVTGQGGGKNAFVLIYSFIIAGLYSFAAAGLRLWQETFTTGAFSMGFRGGVKFDGMAIPSLEAVTTKIKAVFSLGTGAEFLGLGFIIGVRYASIICAGSFLSWFVIVPLLAPMGMEELHKLNAELKADGEPVERFVYAGAFDAPEMPAPAPVEEGEEPVEVTEVKVDVPADLRAAFEMRGIELSETAQLVRDIEEDAEAELRIVDEARTSNYELAITDAGLTVSAYQATADGIFGAIPKNMGIGCIFAAGLLSILKMGKVIVTALKEAMGSLFRKSGDGIAAHDRTDEDISYPVLLLLGIVCTAAIALYFRFVVFQGMTYASGEAANANWLTFVSVVLALLVSFVFITVSAWAIATISVTPISGMTVTTIIITAVALLAAGLPKGDRGMLAVLLVGGVVASALSMAGTLVTEFKIGYWAGSSPRKIQWSAIIASLLASAVVTGTIMLLAGTYGFDPEVKANALQAPQANLMKSALQSFVGTGSVPWLMYGVGVALALLLQLIGISPLAFGLGMYLPMELNTPILVGAIVAALVQKGSKSEEHGKARSEKGILIASGFIAGAAIMGVILSILRAVAPGLLESMNIPRYFAQSAESAAAVARTTNWLGIAAFLALCVFVFIDARRAKPAPVMASESPGEQQDAAGPQER